MNRRTLQGLAMLASMGDIFNRRRTFAMVADADRERKPPKNYTRHQGAREQERRQRQLASGHRRTA